MGSELASLENMAAVRLIYVNASCQDRGSADRGLGSEGTKDS